MRTMKRVAAFAMTIAVMMTSGVTTKAAVTTVQPAKDVSEAKLNWEAKVGEGFDEATYDNNTLSKIKVVGDYIYAADDHQHRIMKINKKTGKIEKQSKYYDPSYIQYYVGCIGYGDGKVYVSYDNGRVQAFDEKTLKSLWITDENKNAIASELVYNDGKLYFGTRSKTSDYNGDGAPFSYYVVTTSDDDKNKTDEEKTMKKLVDSKTGNFYLKNAVVVGKYIVVSDTEGTITIINTTNDEITDTKETDKQFSGNLTYDKITRTIYFVAGTNDLYGIRVSEDGKFQDEKMLKLYNTGYCATTPEVYNGKVYVSGTKGKAFTDKGYIAVVDVSSNKYKLNYMVELSNYSQGEPTIVKTGKDSVRVYFTINDTPGGVYAIEDSKGATSAKLETIYEPVGNAQNSGCMSDVTVDKDGTMYFSNDSKYIFAVAKQPITKTQTTTRSVKLTWKKNKSAKGYVIYAKAGKGKYKKLTTVGKTTKKTVKVNAGTSYKFKVKPYTYTKKKGKKVTKYYKTYAAKAKNGSKTVKITYKNVKGYTSYRIDMKVGNSSYKKVMTSKKTGTLTLTYTQKNAKVGKSYKFRLVGIKKVNGKDVEKTIK